LSARFTFSRIRFTAKADNALRTLAGRSGLRPNILSRIAFAYSLSLPDAPPPIVEQEMGSREINRHTLLGDLEASFRALLVQSEHRTDDPNLDQLCFSHIHRGIFALLRMTASCRGAMVFSKALMERMPGKVEVVD
jgi:DNA sulfur modification protein DndE